MIEYEDLEKLAYTDDLTGLRNEHGLMRDYYGADLKDVHFIYVDIDDFNKMIAIFGAHAIDDMLINVSNTLIDYCGKSDVYRIGVDQFLMVTHNDYMSDPDRLHSIFKKPIMFVSMYVSGFSNEYLTPACARAFY